MCSTSSTPWACCPRMQATGCRRCPCRRPRPCRCARREARGRRAGRGRGRGGRRGSRGARRPRAAPWRRPRRLPFESAPLASADLCVTLSNRGHACAGKPLERRRIRTAVGSRGPGVQPGSRTCALRRSTGSDARSDLPPASERERAVIVVPIILTEPTSLREQLTGVTRQLSERTGSQTSLHWLIWQKNICKIPQTYVLPITPVNHSTRPTGGLGPPAFTAPRALSGLWKAPWGPSIPACRAHGSPSASWRCEARAQRRSAPTDAPSRARPVPESRDFARLRAHAAARGAPSTHTTFLLPPHCFTPLRPSSAAWRWPPPLGYLTPPPTRSWPPRSPSAPRGLASWRPRRTSSSRRACT